MIIDKKENEALLKRKIHYDIIIFLSFFFFLEFFSNLILKEYFLQDDSVRLDLNPIYELDDNLSRIRRNPFETKTIRFDPIYKTSENVTFSFPIPSRINFNNREGAIKSATGDWVINRHGFRGPYFEKEAKIGIIRILALGGSTTAGGHENELTWPRSLERMLNHKINQGTHFQMVNGGVRVIILAT